LQIFHGQDVANASYIAKIYWNRIAIGSLVAGWYSSHPYMCFHILAEITKQLPSLHTALQDGLNSGIDTHDR
jgi:hypothetical protein